MPLYARWGHNTFLLFQNIVIQRQKTAIEILDKREKVENQGPMSYLVKCKKENKQIKYLRT